MIIARQSTARTVMIGPVLDADGVAVTDCVVADFEGSVNGGDPAALNGSATLTHRGVGFYSLALTATDLGTVGSFEVTINDTTNACAIKELTVIEEAVYDALFAASANAFTGAAGSSKVTGVVLTDTVTTYTGNTPQTGDAYARIGATGSGLTTLASQSSVDDLPTNAELNTALGTADDAVLAAIAALNNLSAAQVNAEVDTALSDYDGPTNAELATALGTADDAILAAIAALNNLSSAQAQTAVTSALTAALTEGYRGTGATGSVRDLLYEIIAHMGESSISSVTKTLKKLDGSTTAKTYTLDSSSAPTSITETT
jgi:hypothetical protein